jgi:hypothetical protein
MEMHKHLKLVSLSFILMTIAAAAQTPVQTAVPNSVGYVPVFGPDSNTTATNSPIFVSGSNVGIGTTHPTAVLDVERSSNNSWDGQFVFAYGSSSTNGSSWSNGPVINVVRSEGTLLSPLALKLGDSLGMIAFVGYTGTTYYDGSFIQSFATENWSNAGNGTGLSFWTVPNGSSNSGSERMRIDQNGYIGIGTPNPTYKLDVAGQIRSSAGGVVFPDGSTQTTAYNQVVSGSNVITQSNGFVGVGRNPAVPFDVLSSTVPSATIARFQNSMDGSYTTIGAAGSSSTQPTWASGSSILEFTPAASGNGIISSYSGKLLFETGARTNQMALTSDGKVGIGTPEPARKLHIAGDVQIDGSLYFGNNQTAQSSPYAGSACQGGDYAESIDVTGDRSGYTPGDVLVIDPNSPGRFLKSNEPYSIAVMGIYSTKPGVLGRRQLTEKSPDEVPMAMVGIVPTKVSAENGPIRPGDLLVSSSTPGYAMKGTDRSKMLGAVLGKALASLDSGKGLIEVGVTLQ